MHLHTVMMRALPSLGLITCCDQMVHSVTVLEEYVSSDHKPLAVTFNNLVSIHVPPQMAHSGCDSSTRTVIDWTKVNENCIANYMTTLDSMLCCLSIPVCVFNECGLNDCVQHEIDEYYSSFMSCVMNACYVCLPVRQINPVHDYVIRAGMTSSVISINWLVILT